MGKAYSYDLRVRALEYIKRGHTGLETGRTFGISRKVLYDWMQLEKVTGSLGERLRKGRPTTLKNPEEFKQFIEKNYDKTRRELAAIWPGKVSASTIGRWGHKFGYTFKKNVLSPESGRRTTCIISKAHKTV